MLTRNRKTATSGGDNFTTVVEGLKSIYKDKILPLEEQYLFHDLVMPKLTNQDFDAKPTVLLIGQYSTGKTTFIRYLLGGNFPGDRVGPDPTTDRFIAVMHGDQEGIIPGHAVVVDPSKPFVPLSEFGNGFLQRFQISQMNSPVLRSLTIIDTPGILSGEKQRIDRGYDFTAVLRWFAARVDRIILLFDAHKLDISDEFQRTIEVLKGHDDKIRIILNKADMVNNQELMRVYGALMWSLGKIFLTPEVARVYIGSFWDEAFRNEYNRKLFEAEEDDLIREIQLLPCTVALRKLNDLVKRARQAKVNAFMIKALNEKSGASMFNRDYKKKETIKHLRQLFAQIQKEQNLSQGDFPDVAEMQQKLKSLDWNLFKSFNKKFLEDVDAALSDKICRLVNMIQQEQEATGTETRVRGGLFEKSIFERGRGEGVDKGSLQTEWAVEKHLYLAQYNRTKEADGRVSAATAKEEMLKSALPNSLLGKIWRLADIDRDGMLDEDEYCLAMHLINIKLQGHDIPSELPQHLVPPRKQRFSPF